MYIVKYGDAYLHDPRGDESLLTDAKLSGGLNQAGSLVFTMAPNHPLLGTVRERDASSPVEVYDGGVLVFAGYVWELSQDFKNTRTASCKGELAYLGDSLVRPYSTVEGEAKLSAPSSVSGYFQWLIDQHNSRVSEAQRFDVGRNEGALLDKNDRIYRASSQIPTTSEELQSKLLDGPGGYVFVRRENGRRVIDYLADCVDVNAQVIDFGVNLLDYARTDSASSLYTAIRPKGGKPDGSDEYATLESLPDGTYSKDARFRKDGDVVYDAEAVRKYGMIELEWSDSEAATADGLLDSAVIALKEHTSPKTTIEIKAVDMSMFMDGYSPLRPGQLVRVRSKPHGFDSYMLVAKIDPDLNDPSQTVYTLGTTFDTVTGETNKQIRRLNASINAQIDAVAGISAEAKEAAEGALRTSEEAQTAADAASAKANQAVDDLAAAEQNLANVASRVDATEEEVSAAKAAVATAQAAADKAKADAATAQSTANTAKANADTAQTAANNAKAAADAAQDAADGINLTVSEVKETANAAKDAIDGLEVGGRNLVLDSMANDTSNHEYAFDTRNLSVVLEPNTTYTLTVNGRTNDDKTSEDNKYLNVFLYADDWSWNKNISIKERKDTTKSYTFTTPNDTSKIRKVTAYYYPSVDSSGVSSAGTCTVNWYKLERGNKATDWTPAPEDIETRVEGCETAVGAAGIKAENNSTMISSLSTELNVYKGTVEAKFTDERKYVDGRTEVVENWIREGSDGTSSFLELGGTDSNFKSRLTSTELGFYEGNAKVAHIGNKQMHINDADIDTASIDKLTIGKYSFVASSDGHLTLVYTG